MERTAAPPALLMVGNFLSGAGGRRGVCEDLAERLRSAGWTVRTTSTQPGRVRRLSDMLGTVWRRRGQYAVAQVDAYSGPAFLWAAAVAFLLRRLGKPFILTLHGGNLPAFSRRRRRLVGAVLRMAAAVTAPSAYLVREMKAWRADILLLPNALDVARYPFSLRERPQPRLVWLRAFHETYNPALAPEVLARLAPHEPDVRLTMVGPDKGDGSLERTRAAARRLGVESRLEILGGVPKERVGETLARADVFLNTTNVDNSPVSVVEAMACGLCVVSTDVGGIPDLVRDGENGLLVPPSDVERMAAAVGSLLGDPARAARLSRNGRNTAQGFDWSAVLPEWERLLRGVAGDRRREVR